nr:MAG TPA: hypothetical protein [Caudoviricetes sp.]
MLTITSFFDKNRNCVLGVPGVHYKCRRQMSYR